MKIETHTKQFDWVKFCIWCTSKEQALIYSYFLNSTSKNTRSNIMHLEDTSVLGYHVLLTGKLLQLEKRLLDTWDRNGSTSGPTPWKIYDDDDDSCSSEEALCLLLQLWQRLETIYQSMWGSIPKDLNVQHHCCENLKYCTMHLLFYLLPHYHMVPMLISIQITIHIVTECTAA